MSDKELAKAITDRIFSLGGGCGDPVNRIQFMAGTWPGDEHPRGGLNREAFQREVEQSITAHQGALRQHAEALAEALGTVLAFEFDNTASLSGSDWDEIRDRLTAYRAESAKGGV